MNKLYGLTVLEDDGICWSECYVFSHSISKLKAVAVLPEGVTWCAQRSECSRDVVGEDVVMYTTNYDINGEKSGDGPYYMIVEVPFII